MADYVRICPRCGQANPEFESVCTGCGQFIALEPVQRADQAPEPRGAAEPPEPAAAGDREPADDSLLLELAPGQAPLRVRDGAVLGQAHPGAGADLTLSTEVAGSQYVHRRHCRFERRDGRWRIVALDQAPLGSAFTNPTFVNGERLAPGASRDLADGDELRLAAVVLVVHILGSEG
jgi:hypothetical protein